jgi:cobalt-zinc-cadmium efflux system outer membrane protein
MNFVFFAKLILVFSFIFGFINVEAQTLSTNDTVNLSLADAEKLFVERNISVLSAKYGIEAAKSAVKQAGLWSNPNISIEQNIYNQYTGKFFDFTTSGNTEFQLQQLFLLAGKRSKQVKLAELNVKSQELSLLDLLRSIKNQIREDLLSDFYFNNALYFYDSIIPNLKMTIQSAEKNYKNKLLLLSELIRLKSLLFTLQNERLDIINKIDQVQADIKVILNDSTMNKKIYKPILDTVLISSFDITHYKFEDLVEEAYKSRPDIQIAENTINYEEANLSLQKSLAVPDLNVGLRWSRAGGYIPNYWAVNFAIDLPFFNKNQGNIEISQSNIKSDEMNLKQLKKEVEKDVLTSYNKAVTINNFYKSIDGSFISHYNELVKGMDDNFEKHNITMIEYIDFYESYRTSMLQLNQLMNDRAMALENLNFVIGKNIFNP